MAQRSRRSAPPGATAPGRSPAQLGALRDRARELIEPVLAKAGYDLENVAVRQIGRRHQLRVTVDGDGGVSLDTIADLSRAIAEAMDAAESSGEEIFPGEYQLEVSSPGVDRPLTLPRHWRRAVGRMVAVTVHEAGRAGATEADATASGAATADGPRSGRSAGAAKTRQSADRQVTGRVLAADETSVTLEIAEKKSVSTRTFALDQLGPGRVQIEFNRLDEISDEDLEEIVADDADADVDDEEDDEEDVEEQ